MNPSVNPTCTTIFCVLLPTIFCANPRCSYLDHLCHYNHSPDDPYCSHWFQQQLPSLPCNSPASLASRVKVPKAYMRSVTPGPNSRQVFSQDGFLGFPALSLTHSFSSLWPSHPLNAPLPWSRSSGPFSFLSTAYYCSSALSHDLNILSSKPLSTHVLNYCLSPQTAM